MPGVYLEYIKAGRFVVPVELSFQTESIITPGDLRGLVRTSKWIERQNWKEIKAMLKPAVEACLKYNDTPLENIPKSHHISYGREVSLGYLIVPNKVSTPFMHILDTKKNCWTDDEDDEDELLGISNSNSLKDHGSEFTECIPTKTAIRVCVVKKSIVSIEDARRIRKELGVRSEDVRNYFASATSALSNEAGPSSLPIENNEQINHETQPPTEQGSARSDRSSDSETENEPRTYGDPEEIRECARIYKLVLNQGDADSGEDPDDDLSLPDIEPNPPKRKKTPRNRKKSISQSPSKSKRLTHTNILSLSQNSQDSEEETGKRSGKRAKRKRTVAVVEPMRTLPNGQISFEHAIGALGTEKRRKARPGSSHCTDKTHSGGGRSKQTPAIDIIAPDDDRLTITNPPEPIPVVTSAAPAPNSSPSKDTAEKDSEYERRKLKKKKRRRRVNIDDDPHKWERLTPSPIFDDMDDFQVDHIPEVTTSSESEDADPEMPVLTKMVDSDEERSESEGRTQANESTISKETTRENLASSADKDRKGDKECVPSLSKNTTECSSSDTPQVKANENGRVMENAFASSQRKNLAGSLEQESKRSENSLSLNKSGANAGSAFVRTGAISNSLITGNKPSISESYKMDNTYAKSNSGNSLKSQVKTASVTVVSRTKQNTTNFAKSSTKDTPKAIPRKSLTAAPKDSPPQRETSQSALKTVFLELFQNTKNFKKVSTNSPALPSPSSSSGIRPPEITSDSNESKTSSRAGHPAFDIAPMIVSPGPSVAPTQVSYTALAAPIPSRSPSLSAALVSSVPPARSKSPPFSAPLVRSKSPPFSAPQVRSKSPTSAIPIRSGASSTSVIPARSVPSTTSANPARSIPSSTLANPARSISSSTSASPGRSVPSSNSANLIRSIPSLTSAPPKRSVPSAASTPPVRPVSSTISAPLVCSASTSPPIRSASSSTLAPLTTPIIPVQKKKKKLKQKKKATSTKVTKKTNSKPQTGDAETQTDDLEVIAFIERQTSSTPSIISASKIKLSRSCDASSEDELCDFSSQRSRTPGALSDTSQQNTPSKPSVHPAIGSPRDDYDEDGLFSFESPTIPQSSPAHQISPSLSRTTSEELLQSHLEEPTEVDDENDTTLLEIEPTRNHNSLLEIGERRTSISPQPGCSHWSNLSVNRPDTPPPPTLTSSALMPPPMSRPPRSPRKGYDKKFDPAPRLSLCSSPEPPMDHEMEHQDTMEMGAEAANVLIARDDSVGRIYDMLNQPSLIKEGVKMMQQFSSNQLSIDEMERKLETDEIYKMKPPDISKALVPVSSATRKRSLSPDICDIVPDKRLRLAVEARRSRRESFMEASRINNLSVAGTDDKDAGTSNAVVLRRITSDDEANDIDEANFRPGASYEPHGDEFDLSQRSLCMLNVVPNYEMKSRLYKIHAKTIRETSIRDIIEHFKAIRPELNNIFQGLIPSFRHNIYVGGNGGRELRNLNLMVPFTSDQGSTIVTLINDHLVPDRTRRYDYMEYVMYVLKPEAFIRIYSRINKVSFQMAETEMRYRACYVGDVLQKHLSVTAGTEEVE